MRLDRLPLPTLALCAAAASACGDSPAPPVDVAWKEAFPARELGWLLGIWGPSPDDLYAVGGTPDEGMIMHFDGTAWTELDLGFRVPLLNWSYGFGPNDITFVGNEGTILHYDGSTFTRSATVTDQALWGVFGTSPSDLWAVGGDGFLAGQATVLRYDGTSWRRVEPPVLQHPDVFSFFKVWGSAPDDVYIVGQRGVVLHWDGSALSELFVGTGEDLVTVFGLARDRIAIVGGRSNGELITFDGAEWKREQLAPLPGLNAVWFRDPEHVHIGGEDGTLATFDWTARTYEVEPYDTHLVVHAMFGDSSGKLTAVGGSLLSAEAPFRGLAIQRGLAEEE